MAFTQISPKDHQELLASLYYSLGSSGARFYVLSGTMPDPSSISVSTQNSFEDQFGTGVLLKYNLYGRVAFSPYVNGQTAFDAVMHQTKATQVVADNTGEATWWCWLYPGGSGHCLIGDVTDYTGTGSLRIPVTAIIQGEKYVMGKFTLTLPHRFEWGSNDSTGVNQGGGGTPSPEVTHVRRHVGGGYENSFAIDEYGRLQHWGISDVNDPTPSTYGQVLELAGYDYKYIALLADGTTEEWGNSVSAGVAKPAGLSNVVSVSAGEDHFCALKDDGTVVCWGDNTSFQCDVPAGLTGVVQISCGGFFTAALKDDGTVVVWGYDGDPEVQPPQGVVATQLATRSYATVLALQEDGTVIAWGDPLEDSGQQQVPAGLTDVVQVAGTEYASLALKSDGTVVAWGDDTNGVVSGIPAGLSNVVQIIGGSYHVMALKDDHSIVSWGWNSNGQTDVPGGINFLLPGETPLTPPVELQDAQVLYHAPEYGDGDNHGQMGNNGSDYALSFPTVGPAKDYQGSTSDGMNPYPNVFTGATPTGGQVPIATAFGSSGTDFTVLLGFRPWHNDDNDPPVFGDILHIEAPGNTTIMRVTANEYGGSYGSRGRADIVVATEAGNMTSMQLEDISNQWQVLVIKCEGGTLKYYLHASNGLQLTNTVNNASPLLGAQTGPSAATITLGHAGMASTGLAIFDQALGDGDITNLIMNNQFKDLTQPPQ